MQAAPVVNIYLFAKIPENYLMPLMEQRTPRLHASKRFQSQGRKREKKLLFTAVKSISHRDSEEREQNNFFIA